MSWRKIIVTRDFQRNFLTKIPDFPWPFSMTFSMIFSTFSLLINFHQKLRKVFKPQNAVLRFQNFAKYSKMHIRFSISSFQRPFLESWNYSGLRKSWSLVSRHECPKFSKFLTRLGLNYEYLFHGEFPSVCFSFLSKSEIFKNDFFPRALDLPQVQLGKKGEEVKMFVF